jgi:transporter family protein
LSPADRAEIRAARPGAPAWLWYSLLTIVFWGAWGLQSKLIVERISPWMNQVLFPLGLLPLMGWMLLSKRSREGSNKKLGAVHAFVTGILGAAGNIAFYVALERGGSVSVVVPLTCLFPVVTVIAARFVLREKLTGCQIAGLALALVSIWLLGA